MKKLLMCLSAILLMVTGLVSSSRADISNAAVLFLRIAPGARAAGMGETFVAIADDATATHYNPAGLGSYPLSSSTIEVKIPGGYRPIKSMALLKTGKSNSIDDFEVWALTAAGLMRMKDGAWSSGEVSSTRTDQTISQIASRYYTVVNPEELPALIEKVAAANNRMAIDSVTAFREQVLAMAPSDYSDRVALEQSLDSLVELWSQVRINWDRFAEARSIFADARKDSALTARETERIQFAVERSRNRYIPEDVTLPFSVRLNGEPTTLAAQEDILLIGTNAGLVRFNGKSWQTYTKEGGLPSDTITALRSQNGSILVGTTAGMARYNLLTIEPFDSASGAPTGRVEIVGGGTGNELYAVVDGDLYHFDGNYWSNSFPYTVVIDDTPEKIAAKFSIYGTQADMQQYLEKFRKANAGAEGLEHLEPGTVVMAPYVGSLKGKISAVVGGVPGQLVWVGSNYGVMMLSRDGWQMPGYREWTAADTITTIAQVAALRKDLKGVTPEEYTEALKDINDLPEGIIPPGRSVRHFKNAAATPTTSIDWVEGTVYVGTEEGLLEYSHGEWRRSSLRGLGNEPTRRVSMLNSQVWAASEGRIVTSVAGRPDFSTMYVKWLPELADDLYYTHFTKTFPITGFGTIGISSYFISYGTITRTGENAQDLGTFDAFDLAFQASYGTSLSRKWKGGISAKFLWSRLADQGAGLEKGKGSSQGFALDFGVLYHANDRMTLGAALTNLGPKMSYIDANQADDLPRNLGVGVAYKLLESRDAKMVASVEYNKMMVGLNDSFSDELLKQAVFNGGAEFTLLNLIAFRAGYVYDEEGDASHATFGAGIRALERFRFDVAYIPSGGSVALANIARFSFSAQF